MQPLRRRARPAPRACPTEAITFEEAETADWIGDFAAERTDAACSARGGPLMPARHLIIGGGTAGLNAIRTIREEERCEAASEITLVSAERPYSRMVLPYYLGRTIAESPCVHCARPASLDRLEGEGHWSAAGPRRSTPAARTLTLDDGATVEFDDCLIATGSRAARAPIPGADGPGVHCFWTLDEAAAVIAGIAPGSRVVMVGRRLHRVHDPERDPGPRGQAHHRGGRARASCRAWWTTRARRIVRRWLEDHGVTVRTGAT